MARRGNVVILTSYKYPFVIYIPSTTLSQKDCQSPFILIISQLCALHCEESRIGRLSPLGDKVQGNILLAALTSEI